MPEPSNRAVSSAFRVFGRKEEPIVADSVDLATCVGMHRDEVAALAWLVPLSVYLALVKYTGLLLAIPLAFFALHFLPFLLRARTPPVQWRLWLLLGVAWGILNRQETGVTGALAFAWLGFGLLELAASLVLAWRRSCAFRLGVFVGVHAGVIGMGIRFGWPWAVLAGAAVAAITCGAILHPNLPWLGPVHRHTGSSRILITLDDGPDPEVTPRLLDLLDRHRTKAVFFMIGEKVAAHPELAREVIRRGHEIGNHTQTHPQASFWCAGPLRTRREISRCQAVIRETTGSTPRWFRAPVGHRNLFTHPIARSLGLEVMGWSRRGYDGVERDAQKVLARILPHLQAGDIVLLHDGTPIAEQVLAGVLEELPEVES